MATTYPTSADMLARLANDHTYHAPFGDQGERYEANRDAALQMATGLVLRCPPSRELSLALTALDEVVFFSNAAIARNEKA